MWNAFLSLYIWQKRKFFANSSTYPPPVDSNENLEDSFPMKMQEVFLEMFYFSLFLNLYKMI